MLENMTKRVAYSALHLDLLVITLTVVIRENGKKKRFYLSASTVQGVSAKCFCYKNRKQDLNILPSPSKSSPSEFTYPAYMMRLPPAASFS